MKRVVSIYLFIAVFAMSAVFTSCNKEKFSVTFDSNGGSNIATQTVSSGNKVEKPQNPTKDRYTFVAWYKDEGLTTDWNFTTDVVTSDITLFSRWSENTFTVTFHSNEGSAVAPQTVAEGGKATKPDDPTRSGYKFVAWFKKIELTNDWKFDFDVVISDVTLYAKWIEWTDEEEDPMYPTTIYRLSDEVIAKKRSDFSQSNPNLITSLNQFGLCGVLSPSGGDGSSGGFTEEEAIAAVKEFVARNPEYTGVKNPNDLRFRIINRSVYNNAVFWAFRTENQTINNIEVVFSEILFNTRNRELIGCQGNHFPDVYIPQKFKFDTVQAKSQLLGREITHWGWSGPYTVGPVTAEHLQESSTKLIILPLTDSVEYGDAEKIELRVAWQIYLSSLYHIFEVDVMTGEMVRETPTIIH